MRTLTLGMICLCAMPSAQGDIVASSPDGFHLKLAQSSDLNCSELDGKITDLPRWWSSDHTYSGDTNNLSLASVSEGGVWQENWDTGWVEHGRLVAKFVNPDGSHTFRFDASLGPLQAMGVEAVLTIALSEETDAETTAHCAVAFEYVVTGSDFQSLDAVAAPVDRVLSEQIMRLASTD